MPVRGIDDDDRRRAERLFRGGAASGSGSIPRQAASTWQLIEDCLGSNSFRSEVERFAHRIGPSLFSRAGNLDHGDVDWLARAVPAFSSRIRDLTGAPDRRAFYAGLFRLPPFASALRSLPDHRAADLFLDALGPPVTMIWPDGWGRESGPQVGCFDAIERGLARGWVRDPRHPEQPASVEFIVDGCVVHTARASYYRDDVKRNDCGSGFAGFETQLPTELIGRDVAIGARLQGSKLELSDSPKRLGPPPALQRWQFRGRRVCGDLLARLRARLDRKAGGSVSLILPVGAVAVVEDVRRTVEGVQGQWCSCWELLCLPGPKLTGEIGQVLNEVAADDPRVRILAAPEREGPAPAFGQILSQARGRLVVALESGDVLEPDTVHRLLEAARSGADFLYAGTILTLDELEDVTTPFRAAPFVHEWLVKEPPSVNMAAVETAFARRLVQVGAVPHARGWPDLEAAAAREAQVIAHMPGLFRWRTRRRPDGEIRLTQLPDADPGGEPRVRQDHGDAKEGLKFTLAGRLPRDILLAPTGLVPLQGSVEVDPAPCGLVDERPAGRETGARVLAAPEIARPDVAPPSRPPPSGEVADAAVVLRVPAAPAPDVTAADVSVVLALASRARPIGDPQSYAEACASLVRGLEMLGCRQVIAVVDVSNAEIAALPFAGERLHVIDYRHEQPGVPAMVNAGAVEASGELLLILDEPHELALRHGFQPFFDRLAEPHVGAVGARLIRSDGESAVNEIVLASGFPLLLTVRPFPSAPSEACPPGVRNVGALAPPFMTRSDLFRTVGGYDEAIASVYCHVDYAFRVRETGRAIVFVPEVAFREWAPGRSELVPDAAALRVLAMRRPRSLFPDAFRPEARFLPAWERAGNLGERLP